MTATLQRRRSNGRAKPVISLSSQDRHHLLIFERRCDFVRDRTRSVADRYQNGLYLVGRPGSGKTHTVIETLESINARYIYRNSRMTPMGLFEELCAHPEHTIVLDDISALFDQRQALQILMAALDGKPGQARPVTYTAKNKHERRSFYFRGGIIAISNIPLRRDPLAEAIVSRVVLQEHEPTDEELAAVMRHAAIKGNEDMSPEECNVVVEFVIQESRANDFRLDLRFMGKGLQDYRQQRDGKARRPWQELIRASMKQILRQAPRSAPSKQDEIKLECEMVSRLIEKYPDDTPRQITESGLSKSTFYERRRMLRTAG